jgi:luciferase family oxidoreductase group 1
VKLSVLDQSPSAEGDTQDVAIRQSLSLAQACDAIGYHRYWLSEHHNSASIVGTAPEILMAAIAATTRRIRIGSAGVMLPHYSALKVAEQYARAIAPGRPPAAGLDRLNAQAQSAPERRHEFPRQVVELMHSSRGPRPLTSIRFASIGAFRKADEPRDVILAELARGSRAPRLPYAYAYFFTDGAGTGRRSRLSALPPERALPKPMATICMGARQESDERAWHLFKTRGARGPSADYAPLVSLEAASRVRRRPSAHVAPPRPSEPPTPSSQAARARQRSCARRDRRQYLDVRPRGAAAGHELLHAANASS